MTDVRIKARELLEQLKAPPPVTGLGENLMPPSTRIPVETKDGKLGVWRAGPGPATLFVHGWEDTHRTWRRFVQTFLAEGQSVVLMDIPGHGVSEAKYATYPIVAEAVLHAVKQAGPVQAVVAHSFGCIATACALQRGLNVDIAAFIAPPIPTEENNWLTKRRKDGIDESVLATTEEIYQTETGESLETFAMADALTGWGGDLFIAASEQDAKTPVEPVRAFVKDIPRTLLRDDFQADHRALTSDGQVISAVLDFVIGDTATW